MGSHCNHTTSASHKVLGRKVKEALIQGQRQVYFSFREEALEKNNRMDKLANMANVKAGEESLNFRVPLPAGTLQLPEA